MQGIRNLFQIVFLNRSLSFFSIFLYQNLQFLQKAFVPCAAVSRVCNGTSGVVELYVSFSFTLRETRHSHFHHIINTQISLKVLIHQQLNNSPLITITRLFILFTVRMCNYKNRVISRVLILQHGEGGILTCLKVQGRAII